MKRFALLAALLVVATAVAANTPLLEMQVDAYAVEISIAPSSRDPIQLLDRPTPDTYTCIATVRDAATSAPISIARAIVAPGRKEVVTVEDKPWTTTMTVKLSRKTERADTEVVVKKDGKIVNRQFTSVMLKNVDPGVVPLR